jgi:P-type Ca2+ transporter type 2C
MTWHNLTAEEAVSKVGSATSGLSSAEAAQRLTANGPNQLAEAQRINPIWILLSQFKSLIVWILIGAGILSGVFGDLTDAVAILAIVVLNAAIGFYQEFQAEQSIAALKKLTAPLAKVRRDGQVASLPAAQVVVGDILLLEPGDLVAADARLLEAASLRCIESTLTGESEAAEKQPAKLDEEQTPLGDRVNMVFSGTSVAAGTAVAVVVATAADTELGKIAGLLTDAGGEQDTPLQKKLDAVGRILVWAALGVVALVFGLGLRRGSPLVEQLITAISLAVAAVPEGLPAVVTAALSLGVSRMARRRALVRKLAAVETLGSTSVICTDKTGTLTIGEMTARSLYVAGQSYPLTDQALQPTDPLRELSTVLIGCNNARLTPNVVGDPTEVALLRAGIKAGGDVDRLPFDSDRKRSAVIRQMPNQKLRALINGAPDSLLERCSQLYTSAGIQPLTDTDRQHILGQIKAMAEQALRVLGSAYRDLEAPPPEGFTAEAVEQNLVFVGLTGMYDPPRPEAKAAIATCHVAGIRVVMITGDHPHTAAAIAKEIGIGAGEPAITGVDLDQMSDEVLSERVAEIPVYARVTAAHKLRIVRALKAKGAVVAMTGDGVNDAPAIKGADIGIAMGITGTEVTKQSADMIITDDNFSTIVAAVEEGRGIYNNIRKTLEFLLAGNTGELLLMTVAVALNLPLPLLPIHLLWINLLTDGLPALCLAADPIDPDVMKHRPRLRSERITDRGLLGRMLLTGVLTAGVSFAAFLYTLRIDSVEMARGVAFSVLVFAELLRSFGVRSETKPLWRVDFFSNRNLVLVVAGSLALQLWSQHNAVLGQFLKTPPMPWLDGLVMLGLGAIPLVVIAAINGRAELARTK